MGCITALLESGAKRVSDKGSYIEGGGIYEGYEYLVVLNHMGFRCGYVAINENHPFYVCKDYDALDVKVHGGCTFYGRQMTDSNCSDNWIGFDCGHAWDLNDYDALLAHDPAKQGYVDIVRQRDINFPMDGEIRTKEYVESECKSIIDQIRG